MKITEIFVSIFEVPANTGRFDLVEQVTAGKQRWTATRSLMQRAERQTEEIHVLHVLTDEGIEGVCTVGDARYTTLRAQDLIQLRILAADADPFDRERLFAKLHAATRGMFAQPGWFGAFDNCLWDIAGKAAGLPVYALMGRARTACPAYYNSGGRTKEAVVEDSLKAVEMGFTAVKDHLTNSADENIEWFAAIRDAVGPQVTLLHDAVLSHYNYDEALRVGRALEDLRFLWLEEPLPDRDQQGLQRLCAALDIPVLAPETLMNDVDLSAQWLISGATDWLRGNARVGVTGLLKLAHLAEMHNARIELNGPGGLFGLVHAHMVCALQNTSYYEYFPGGTRDELGREIGLLNPPVPQNGMIQPPTGPGWGAEWDWACFEKKRTATV
ncbi:MAG: enolase C-terminal domain-like protein [Caldilineaceae bacterium]